MDGWGNVELELVDFDRAVEVGKSMSLSCTLQSSVFVVHSVSQPFTPVLTAVRVLAMKVGLFVPWYF